MRWNPPETVDAYMKTLPRTADGRVMTSIDLYGMEDFALDHLTAIDGDLSPLYDPEQDAIAAVYFTDDYNEAEWDSN